MVARGRRRRQPRAAESAARSAKRISVHGVREQRDLARPLDRHRHLPLVPPAGAGDPARADLPLLGGVPPELVVVLVIDLLDLLLAEVTGLPPGRSGGRRAA